MKKKLAFLGLVLLSIVVSAQVNEEEAFKKMDQEFENYAKKQDEIFEKYAKQNDEYIKKLDDEWKEYLKEKFKEFELYKKSQPSIGPKPKVKPILQKKVDVKTKKIAIADEVKSIPIPPKVVTPIIHKTEPDNFNSSSIYLDFYGTNFSVSYDANFMKKFDGHISEESISNQFEQMSKTNYNHLIDNLNEYAVQMNLNDWGYYMLVKDLSEKIEQNEAGAVFLQWFLLIKSNYKARIGYRGDKMYLLLPSVTNIYDVPFFTFKGLKYYLINGDGSNIMTYKKDFPEATKIFDLNIDKPLATSEKDKVKRVKFSYLGKAYEFDVKVNENAIAFYNDMPLSDANVYFDATISATTKESLKEGLMPIIKGKSEADAASILLHFVQTAFDYKTDQDQFGREKFFFPEELFQYDYSDCEDRAVLFSYLVREFLKLDVVGVGYSGHMATAVHFNDNVSGDFITHRGEKFTICDPTYINAPIGLTMPEYVGKPAKIFDLRNSRNAKFEERQIWKKTIAKGGNRGENKGDIAVDKDGNAYLTGYFTGNITLGRFGLNSKNNTKDIFVVKYNINGDVVWAKSFGGDGSEIGYGLRLADNGDVVIVGSFDKSFSFGYKYLKTKTIGDVLVARLNNDGELLWANQVGLEEIGLTQKFMFLSEFAFNGRKIKNKIYREAESFDNFGLAINGKGDVLVTGAPYQVAGLNVQKTSYNSGASFSAPDVILLENNKLLEQKYNPAIAGLFAVINLINTTAVALPGSEAQKALDKYNPNFKKVSPNIYESIGHIQFIKNSEGIVTIKIDNGGEVSFKTLKVNNNARFKVSSFNSGNSKVDVLDGVRIGKSIIWYDLNAVKLFKTGDMIMDYDIDHTKIRMRVDKDILQ